MDSSTRQTNGRLTRSDHRALLLWVVIGLAGALFAFKYYFRAFPEASVNFQISRKEALERAKQFVTGLGGDMRDYQSSIVFDVDDNAKTYLERQLGLEQANRVMSSEIDIWHWEIRFFRPLLEEEYRVRVSASGQIVGYDHTVPEAQAGASLDRGLAQKLAENFLKTKLAKEAHGWDFLPEEANSIRRSKRLDWTFTWEKHAFRAKDAPDRLRITLIGDKIGGAEEFLQVPEAWKRSYEKLRAGNNTLAFVFIVPYLLLLAAAVRIGIQLTRSGQTGWGGAIKLGLLIAALLFLQSLNDWPLWSAGYNTKDAYSSFILQQIVRALLIAVVTAITITLVLPAAEPLYRKSQPDRLRLGRVLTLRGLRSKEFFSSSVVGMSLAAAHIGFVVVFYIVATHYGAWAPQDLNYSDSINTAFPWISGFAIGLLASMNEEFTFRLFAIPFFMRFTRFRWIAVIVPAFLWSFLHSNYPQEPPYIRGIEVGLIGIVAGIVMLRWGIVATLIWHYTVDASLVGLLLVRSNSLYFKISGIVVGAAALAPLLFAGISYLARGGFESHEDLLNRAAPLPEPSSTKRAQVERAAGISPSYEALSMTTIGFLAACLVLGGVVVWRLKPASLGDYLKLSVDAREASARAEAVLRERGTDPRSYHHAAVFVNTTDPQANEFLRERIRISKLNEVYATQVPGALWRVRYFRDGNPEEYAVILKPDGSLHSQRHTLSEDAPGASLDKEAAISLAKRYLLKEKKLDLNQWSLMEATSNKRRHRIDHELIWERKSPLDPPSASSAFQSEEHAFPRIELDVLGDEVANYRTFVKIPENWSRKQSEQTLPRTILMILVFATPAGLGLTILILFLKRLQSEPAHSVPWRRFSIWALWALAGYVLTVALGNRIPIFLNEYRTADPLKLSIGVLGVSFLLLAALCFGGFVLLFGLGWYYGSRAFGREGLPSWTGMPAAYYRDALWIGLGGTAGFGGLDVLVQRAAAWWPTAHRSLEASFGHSFDAYLPAGAVLGTALRNSLFLAGLMAVLAGFIQAEVRRRWQRFLLFALVAVGLAGMDWGSPADFVKELLVSTILLGAAVFGVRRVVRLNLLGGFLVFALSFLAEGLSSLLAQPNTYYRINGYVLLAALVGLLAWPVVAWRRASRDSVGVSI